jgi:hypothetical protein
MTSKTRIAIICTLLLGVAGIGGMTMLRKPSLMTYTYSQFLEQVRHGRIVSAVLLAANAGPVGAVFRLKDGREARTVLPADYRYALREMQEKQVDIEIRASDTGRILINAAPFLLLLGVWIALMIWKFPDGFPAKLP